jgi:hypothetical protein
MSLTSSKKSDSKNKTDAKKRTTTSSSKLFEKCFTAYQQSSSKLLQENSILVQNHSILTKQFITENVLMLRDQFPVEMRRKYITDEPLEEKVDQLNPDEEEVDMNVDNNEKDEKDEEDEEDEEDEKYRKMLEPFERKEDVHVNGMLTIVKSNYYPRIECAPSHEWVIYDENALGRIKKFSVKRATKYGSCRRQKDFKTFVVRDGIQVLWIQRKKAIRKVKSMTNLFTNNLNP